MFTVVLTNEAGNNAGVETQISPDTHNGKKL